MSGNHCGMSAASRPQPGEDNKVSGNWCSVSTATGVRPAQRTTREASAQCGKQELMQSVSFFKSVAQAMKREGTAQSGEWGPELTVLP